MAKHGQGRYRVITQLACEHDYPSASSVSVRVNRHNRFIAAAPCGILKEKPTWVNYASLPCSNTASRRRSLDDLTGSFWPIAVSCVGQVLARARCPVASRKLEAIQSAFP